jgi:hypothetical protein
MTDRLIRPLWGEDEPLLGRFHQTRPRGACTCELLGHLVAVGRAEGLRQIFGAISSSQGAMQAICRELGFRGHEQLGDPSCQMAIDV